MPAYPRDAAERHAPLVMSQLTRTAYLHGQPISWSEATELVQRELLNIEARRHAPDHNGCTDDGSGCLCAPATTRRSEHVDAE